MLGRLRMDVNRQYDDIAKHAFSDVKLLGGDGKFKASKNKEVIKSVVEGIIGNSGSPATKRGAVERGFSIYYAMHWILKRKIH